MPDITAATRRALEIVDRYGPILPGRFARRMWPDSPNWRKVYKCGNHGSSRGVGMNSVGGGLLGKLSRRGLVRRRLGFDTGYVLTDAGKEALAGTGYG